MADLQTFLDETGLDHLWKKIKQNFSDKNHKHGMQEMSFSLYHYTGGDTTQRECWGDKREIIPLTRPTLPDGQFIKVIEIYFMDNDKNQGVQKTIRRSGIESTSQAWNQHVSLFTVSMPSYDTAYMKCKHIKIEDDPSQGIFQLRVDAGYAYDGSTPAKTGEGFIRGTGSSSNPGHDVYAYSGTINDSSDHIGILDVIGYI